MLEKSRDMRGEIKVVDIEWLMPADHLLRKIDAVMDFEEVYDKHEGKQSFRLERQGCIAQMMIAHHREIP